MFAARRNQENLIHGTQKAVKLQNKPGLNCPETPSCRNDENAMGSLAIRTAAAKSEEPQTRRPLGVKTTNAKTKACRALGVKDIVPKDIKNTQAKQSAPRRPPGQKRAKARNHQIWQDPHKSSRNDDGIEYAANLEAPRPFEPDLSFHYDDLKREGVLKEFEDGDEDFIGDSAIANEVLHAPIDELFPWSQEDEERFPAAADFIERRDDTLRILAGEVPLPKRDPLFLSGNSDAEFEYASNLEIPKPFTFEDIIPELNYGDLKREDVLKGFEDEDEAIANSAIKIDDFHWHQDDVDGKPVHLGVQVGFGEETYENIGLGEDIWPERDPFLWLDDEGRFHIDI
ncbi:hypothetical protein CDD82_6491 [Ophiocordyceps australis]|uniref:Uncharacterized protein n=1 Tax=Ophiocordyceps australis TaxID=1399860 RepID=A0A2C5YX20_9HYPO|nr:hypothetical protein CDD82_6491 [Ophiocordyceps australis]